MIDILAHSPATAHFIAKSLAIRFVSDNPPDELVRWMAKRFLETNGDLRETMRAMIYSPEFWNPENFRAKVKSPLELVASAVRAVNGDVDYGFALAGHDESARRTPLPQAGADRIFQSRLGLDEFGVASGAHEFRHCPGAAAKSPASTSMRPSSPAALPRSSAAFS